jgi:hypothetical protein
MACSWVLVAENTYDAGEGAVIRRGQLIAVVGVLLIGCAVFLMAGASGVRAQENIQATDTVHPNTCARIDKKLDENRPLSRKESRLHAGICTYTGHDDLSLTSSASASPTAVPLGGTGGPSILLPAAVLLIGSGILTYAILRRR